MERPTIRIESDGIRTHVYLDGKKIKNCTSLNFCASAKDGIRVHWSGTIQKEDKNGKLIIKDNEIEEEEFRYDSREVVQD